MHALRPTCRGFRQILQKQNCVVRRASISSCTSIVQRIDSKDTTPKSVHDHDGLLCNFRDCYYTLGRNATFMSSVAEAGVAPAAETTKSGSRLDVTREDLISLIETESLALFDVRESSEVDQSGVIAGATNIPLSKLKASFSLDDAEFKATFNTTKPTKDDANILFYGFCSVKSTTALEIVHKLGFKKARHYPGGWEEWSQFTKK